MAKKWGILFGRQEHGAKGFCEPLESAYEGLSTLPMLLPVSVPNLGIVPDLGIESVRKAFTGALHAKPPDAVYGSAQYHASIVRVALACANALTWSGTRVVACLTENWGMVAVLCDEHDDTAPAHSLYGYSVAEGLREPLPLFGRTSELLARRIHEAQLETKREHGRAMSSSVEE